MDKDKEDYEVRLRFALEEAGMISKLPAFLRDDIWIEDMNNLPSGIFHNHSTPVDWSYVQTVDFRHNRRCIAVEDCGVSISVLCNRFENRDDVCKCSL